MIVAKRLLETLGAKVNQEQQQTLELTESISIPCQV